MSNKDFLSFTPTKGFEYFDHCNDAETYIKENVANGNEMLESYVAQVILQGTISEDDILELIPVNFQFDKKWAVSQMIDGKKVQGIDWNEAEYCFYDPTDEESAFLFSDADGNVFPITEVMEMATEWRVKI